MSDSFATPRIAGGQSSLFFTVSQNLLKFIFLSQWCYLTISSSTTLFSFYLQSSPESGSFPVSQPFTSGGQCIGASASASVHPMNVQGWFPLGLTSLISLQLKGFSESSPASNKKVSILPHSAFFMVQLSHPDMTTGKTIALTVWTFICRVMCLLFNMLSRVVTAFFQGASVF